MSMGWRRWERRGRDSCYLMLKCMRAWRFFFFSFILFVPEGTFMTSMLSEHVCRSKACFELSIYSSINLGSCL